MDETKTIVDRERAFHNARFAQKVDPRHFLDKWYRTIQHGAEAQNQLVLRLSPGKDVLEYGCAGGELSVDHLELPSIARTLTGIDISDVAIAKAAASAKAAGYDNCTFLAMNAEAMAFPQGSFDVVFGRGIIHHLDLDRAYGEIVRVLRPGGTAAFYEPLGHNFVLNAYRNRTPDLRTPDEHPLLMRDFELARKYFSSVEVTYFGLASVASAVFPNALREPVYRIGRAADAVLLRLPLIKKYAWYALMVMTK
ncbi:MAG: methyltransferase domain-containing protein [Hyphomicrobiaceae bacterium]